MFDNCVTVLRRFAGCEWSGALANTKQFDLTIRRLGSQCWWKINHTFIADRYYREYTQPGGRNGRNVLYRFRLGPGESGEPGGIDRGVGIRRRDFNVSGEKLEGRNKKRSYRSCLNLFLIDIVSQELGDADPLTLAQVHEHLVRSPPPATWPHTPMFHFPHQNNHNIQNNHNNQSSQVRLTEHQDHNRAPHFLLGKIQPKSPGRGVDSIVELSRSEPSADTRGGYPSFCYFLSLDPLIFYWG